MRTYARIQDGIVAELFRTDGDITAMFNPALLWVDISNHPDVTENWRYDGSVFTAPTAPPPQQPVPTINELQAQISLLGAQLAALSNKH